MAFGRMGYVQKQGVRTIARYAGATIAYSFQVSSYLRAHVRFACAFTCVRRYARLRVCAFARTHTHAHAHVTKKLRYAANQRNATHA